MSPQVEIQLIAVIVAVACSLPGVFLVLRRMSMMSDAITHTILLGIVIGFFAVKSLSSPLLVVGAAAIGVLTVFLIEALNSTKLVSEDSAIGIVFPLLFSIAIIIVSRYAGSVHLDTDSVLLGELAFAPFERLKIFGVDIGAKSIYTMGAIMILNLLFITIFFKELKISAFDSALAAVLGFSPVILHYGLLTLVSITAVGAFEAVGSILVIAFMIGSPVTAYLITDDLKKMLVLSGIIGGFNGIAGYQLAAFFDISIAGSMAVITGTTFILVFIFSPSRGLLSAIKRRRLLRFEFAGNSLLFHLYNHEGMDEEFLESGIDTIKKHLRWDEQFTNTIVRDLMNKGRVFIEGDIVKLTDTGRQYAVYCYENLITGI